jgi:hypothetical protein
MSRRPSRRVRPCRAKVLCGPNGLLGVLPPALAHDERPLLEHAPVQRVGDRHEVSVAAQREDVAAHRSWSTAGPAIASASARNAIPARYMSRRRSNSFMHGCIDHAEVASNRDRARAAISTSPRECSHR